MPTLLIRADEEAKQAQAVKEFEVRQNQLQQIKNDLEKLNQELSNYARITPIIQAMLDLIEKSEQSLLAQKWYFKEFYIGHYHTLNAQTRIARLFQPKTTKANQRVLDLLKQFCQCVDSRWIQYGSYPTVSKHLATFEKLQTQYRSQQAL
jgi:hypothetical protein